MKKVLCRLLFILVFALAFSPSVSASRLMEDLWESASLSRLEEVLPADLPEKEELIEALHTDRLAEENFAPRLFQSALQALKSAASSELALFGLLVLVMGISAFFSAMRQAWFRDSIGDLIDFLCVLAVAGLSYRVLYDLFETARQTLSVLVTFTGSMLPVTSAVYSLSGGVVTATVQSSLLLGALTVLDTLATAYLLPMLSISFALAAANSVSSVDLSSFSRFLRRTASFLIGALFLILTVLLGVQTSLAAASDSLSLRSMRYAAANFIPAVGSMFSEAAKTVFSAVGVLRTGLGFLGIVAILWCLLQPLFTALLRRALFSVLSAVARCFSLEREAVFFSECAETLGVLLGIYFSCGVFFLIAFAVFMQVPIGG